jgi:peptide deformylase
MIIDIIPNEQTPMLPFIENVPEWINTHKELIDAFFEFVKYKDHAIGLAANQASVDGQRCMERFFIKKDVKTKEWSIIINPKIIEYVGLKEGRVEGCLTWQRRDVIAFRYRRVKVGYYTIEGKYHEELVTKFPAHVWQHEINHLDGIPERIEVPGTVWFTDNKIQRNDVCPCGSGKKYKKCCEPYEIDDYVLPRSRAFEALRGDTPGNESKSAE